MNDINAQIAGLTAQFNRNTAPMNFEHFVESNEPTVQQQSNNNLSSGIVILEDIIIRDPVNMGADNGIFSDLQSIEGERSVPNVSILNFYNKIHGKY